MLFRDARVLCEFAQRPTCARHSFGCDLSTEKDDQIKSLKSDNAEFQALLEKTEAMLEEKVAK